MALTTCPECGKENVSDSAVSCPECGYAIKDHFDQIRQEEERKRKEEAALEKIREENKRKIETAPQRQADAIKRSETALERSSKEMRRAGIAFLVLLVLLILFICINPNEWISFTLVFGIGLFIAFVFFYTAKSDKAKATKDLELAKQSIDKYEQNLKERQKEEYLQNLLQARKNEAKHPKCPVCGSTRTERISTVGRAASIATLGLASSKIGKQYQCNNCKHKW